MPGLGPWELVVILLIVVVIFGAGRLSEIGGALGKSVREFRASTHDEAEAAKKAAAAQSAAPAAPAPVATPPVITTGPVPASTAVLVENKCPSCATVNPVEQAFCGQCGTRLTRAA